MTEDTAVKEAEVKKEKKTKAAATMKGQLIHHVIRTISKDGSGTGGSWTAQDAEEYLAQYTFNGWTLFSTHYLDQAPEGYVIMWILVKDQ
jgi:hypothetical protein